MNDDFFFSAPQLKRDPLGGGFDRGFDMQDVPQAFYVAFGLSLVYIISLLRLSAFRRDRQNGDGIFAAPAPITEFLSRDTYDEGGQGLLTWVRIVLILAIVALGWMIRSFAQASGS
ncbi:MAG: hypothetical protein Q8R92_14220 [Deltaproteobacteria bacterium]|nr:hypothetical protein [Deltaproteobacteria bacterium]